MKKICFNTGWSFSFDALYRMQGMNVVRHRSLGNHYTDIDMTNSYFKVNPDIALKTPSGGFGFAEHLVGAKCSVLYECKGLKAYAEGVINIYWNNENNPNLDKIIAPILRIGAKYSFF